MFNFECIQRSGILIGTCIDGFLFGVCCSHPDIFNDHTEPSELLTHETIEIPHIENAIRQQFKSEIISTNLEDSSGDEDGISLITNIDIPSKSEPSALLTKTEPDHSVLLYSINVFDDDKNADSALQQEDSNYQYNIQSERPNDGLKNDSTVSTVMQVHKDLYPDANNTNISPIILYDTKLDKNVVQNEIYDKNDANLLHSNFEITTKASTIKSFSQVTDSTTEDTFHTWTLKPENTDTHSQSMQLMSVTASLQNRFPSLSQNNMGITAYMTVPESPNDSTTPMPDTYNPENQSEEEFLLHGILNKMSESESNNEIFGTSGSSSYLTRLRPTTEKIVQSTNPIMIEDFNTDDPLATWTTEKPNKQSALRPLPTTTTEHHEPLLYWTTVKSTIRPRPRNNTTPRPPSFLLPNRLTTVKPLSTDQLISELIESMAISLTKNDDLPESSIIQQSETEKPWAASTYPIILPENFDISENMIDVDSPDNKFTDDATATPLDDVTPSSTTSITTPQNITLNETSSTVSTTLATSTATNEQSLLLPTATEPSLSGTTPIDEFIEHLLNSLMLSNSSTSPPIDLDLIQMVGSN